MIFICFKNLLRNINVEIIIYDFIFIYFSLEKIFIKLSELHMFEFYYL